MRGFLRCASMRRRFRLTRIRYCAPILISRSWGCFIIGGASDRGNPPPGFPGANLAAGLPPDGIAQCIARGSNCSIRRLSPPATPPKPMKYFVQQNQIVAGPYSLEDLRARLQRGEIAGTDQVCAE